MRPRAGYVGFNRTPTTSAASGVWTLREAEGFRRAGAWPTTGGDPYFADVSLLLHMDGTNGSTTFTDSSGTPKTVTPSGGAAISTAQSKFGGASLFVNGGWLTTQKTSAFEFGTDNFTLEMWLYPTATGGFKTAWSNYQTYGNAANAIFRSVDNNTTKWQFASNGVYPPDIASTTNAIDNAWVFVALVRNGSTLTLYVDGVAESSKDVAGLTFNGNGSFIWIGAAGDNPSGTQFSGYIDELRITKGVARYTANFTPPTAPFPDA